MSHWMWVFALAGVLATAVVCGTDVFFLTVGRAALRLASAEAGTEVMGYFHLFGDARMPVWGVLAIVCNVVLAVASGGEQRWLYVASLGMLVLFVLGYRFLSQPINKVLTKAAKSGETLRNWRELQDSWDRSLFVRVPLLVLSLLAQCLALLLLSA